MSEAEKRLAWRVWEGARDEAALRRYVWALCREAPPAPEAQACVPRTHLIDENMRSTTPFRFEVVRSHVTCSRSVVGSVRRLTVCGPWLPKRRPGMASAYGLWKSMELVAVERIRASTLLYMGADGLLRP